MYRRWPLMQKLPTVARVPSCVESEPAVMVRAKRAIDGGVEMSGVGGINSECFWRRVATKSRGLWGLRHVRIERREFFRKCKIIQAEVVRLFIRDKARNKMAAYQCGHIIARNTIQVHGVAMWDSERPLGSAVVSGHEQLVRRVNACLENKRLGKDGICHNLAERCR